MSDQTPTIQTPSALTGVLGELVGEGKKFKDLEGLAIGKKESDEFIPVLQAENKELRELVVALGTEVEKLKTKATFLDSMRSPTNDDKAKPTLVQAPTQNNQPAQLTNEDVLKLVEQRDASKRADANVAAVDAVLIKNFGADAKTYVTNKATELGLSVDHLMTVAKQSPPAFFHLTGVSVEGGSRNGSLTSQVDGANTTGDQNKGAARNEAYYKKLKTEMGAWKFASNTALQIQRAKDMKNLGDRYFAN